MNTTNQNGVAKFLTETLDGVHDDEREWRVEADGSVTAYGYLGNGTPAHMPVSVEAEKEPDGSLFVGVNAPGARGLHEPTGHGGVYRNWDHAAEALVTGVRAVMEEGR